LSETTVDNQPQTPGAASPPPARGRHRLLFWCAFGLLGAAAAFLLWRQVEQRRERTNALALARQGDFPAAAPLLKRVLERTPEDVEVIEALARGHLDARKLSDAEPHLSRWCELRPDDPTPLRLRLDVYRKLTQPAKALADARRLLELEPTDAEMRRQVRTLSFSAGRFADAEQACREALRERPEEPDLLRFLAQSRRAQGDNAGAGAILDGLLQKQPGDSAALLARAILHFEADQPGKAIPLFRKVIAEDPSRQRTARYHLSQALARAGQAEEAKRVMAEVRVLQEAEILLSESNTRPTDLDLQVRAATALLNADQPARALALLDRALKRAPNHAPAHRLLARHYERQGQAERAAHHRRLAGDKP
jgi:predicted Zn-dependent protease